MPGSLFLEERRRAILDQLDQQGRVTVKALSDELQVSTVTIRQDLRALEAQGLLERTYGGAVGRIEKAPLQELSFTVRQSKYLNQKIAIAKVAAALVQEGYSIALDSSTTVYALVPFLKQVEKLTIVTNSLILAQSFLDYPSIQVLLPGGRLRRDSISLVGQPESLPHVNLNIGFFSARGITDGIGASEIDPDEVIVKQAMLKRCVRVVLLIDGSKWGQVAPYTLIPPEKITHIITTDQAPPDLVRQFRDLGVQVDLLPT